MEPIHNCYQWFWFETGSDICSAVRCVNLNTEELNITVEIRANGTTICIDILVHWEGADLKVVVNFTFIWPGIVKVRWRENQQDASNQMFILKYLSQHVSGIIIPIFRRTRLCTTAYAVIPIFRRKRLCTTAYAVIHNLVLLKMGIMMAETCWDKYLRINIRLVASCSFSLRLTWRFLLILW
jgi:hypothetical protein